MTDNVDADLSAAFDAQSVEADKPAEAAAKPEADVSPEAKTVDGDAEQKDDNPDDASADDKPVPIRAPEGLKPEFKVKFAELSPEWQAEISRREQDAAKGISQYAQEAKTAKELDRVIMPYEPMLATLGVSKPEVIQNMLQTVHVLSNGTPQQKQAVVQGIMSQYGIQIDPDAMDPQVSPEVAELRREIAELKNSFGSQQNQSAQEISQKVQADVHAFASDPQNVFFPDVREHMGKLMSAGLASDLKDAYNKACAMNPEVAKAISSKQANSAQLEAARVAKAAKESAKQVTGSGPGHEPKKPHDDPRDDVRALVEKSWG
jgi:hypothetical protein